MCLCVSERFTRILSVPVSDYYLTNTDKKNNQMSMLLIFYYLVRDQMVLEQMVCIWCFFASSEIGADKINDKMSVV